MADREQRIKVVLDGELKPLVDKLAEALVLMKGFGDKVATQQKAAGAKAGHDAGEALMREYKRLVEEDPRWATHTFDKFLDDTVANTKKRIHELQAEMRKTGDIDVFQKLKNADKDLKALSRLEKDMGEAVERGLVGGAMNSLKEIGTFFQRLGPQAVGALAIAIVAASPLLGAAISGALLAGGGFSAIGLGIAAQFKAPEVQTAWGSLKDNLTQTMQDITAPMAGPITAAMNAIGNSLGKVAGPLEQVFAEIAPYINLIGKGLGGLIEHAGPGFVDFLRASEPILKMISDELPRMGEFIKIFFDEIANSGPGALDGLRTFLEMTGGMIVGLGMVLEALSRTYKALETFVNGVKDVGGAIMEFWLGPGMDNSEKKMGKVGQAAMAALGATEQLAGMQRSAAAAAKAQADALDALNKSIEDNISQNLADSEATIRQKQSVQDLTVSIAQNGNNWDINTEAGRKNTTALNDAISAADRKRIADVKNGQDAVTAAQDYNQEVQALLDIANKAGMSKQALDNLKGTYMIGIDTLVDIQIIARGNTSAASYRAANEMYPSNAQWAGNFITAAAGLLPARTPGTWVLAGEGSTGGEYLIPRRGISSDRAAQLIGAAAADHGLSMKGDGAYLQVTVPLYLNGQQVASATYEDFVNFGQDRKNQRGSTGF